MTELIDMLFTLLRLSLHTEENSTDNCLSAFPNVNSEEWEQMFDLSVRQGVLLLSYGGLQYLPTELQPPRKLKLRWCVNVLKASERYDHYKSVISKLSNLLSENNISLLVIKGITISELYPVPYFRESGDIDIYLSGNTEQVNELISPLGIRKQGGIPKHSTFILDGIPIENHYTFFDTTLRFKRESQLYQKMENILDGMISESKYSPINIGNAYTLHPQVAALYFIGHTFRHFCCLDMNIRHMCDWTVFFSKSKKDIDMDLLAAQIKELGLEKFVRHINSFCSHYLGFKPYIIIPQRIDGESGEFIMKTVIQYRFIPKVHIPIFGVLCYLFRRNSIYKKYMGKVKVSEFLLPEIKNYFMYLLKYRWKSSNKTIGV